MTTIATKMNNAIVLLERAANAAHARGAISASRTDAVRALGRHYATWYQSRERMRTPAIAMVGKMRRYVEWYTRAWTLVPRPWRDTAPRPDAIDVSLSGAATQALASYWGGVEITESATDRAAMALHRDLANAAAIGTSGAVVGLLAGVALVLWLTRR